MNQLFSKKLIPIFVAALIMLAGGGCGDNVQSGQLASSQTQNQAESQAQSKALSSARYQVTVYSGGKAVGTWPAASYSVGDDKVFIQPPGSNSRTIIAGTFVLESTGSATSQQPAGKAQYKVTLYSGGQPVREWTINHYPIAGTVLFLQIPGTNERTIVSGTYVVEALN